MATFKIEKVYIVESKERKLRNGTIVNSERVPENRQHAKQLILNYIKSAIGGRINIKKGTVMTRVDLGRNFSCTHNLGCAAEFSQVR